MNYILDLAILPILIFLVLGTEQVEAALNLVDCQKCHVREYQQIALNGTAHKEQVSCFDCHENHRPQVANNIPECNECHGNAPHQGMADCLSCHGKKVNCSACHMVHQPLVWSGGDTALQHCNVCHSRAVELLRVSVSKHRSLSCTFCHSKHRDIQRCSDCHGLPHPQGTHAMFPQCATCHNIAHDLSPK